MSTDESTELRIVEAAKQVFVSKGFDGARMQDIADLAGINKALLHYYFRSKDKLFSKIFEFIMMNNLPRIASIMKEDIPFETKMREFVASYISLLQANPYAPMFILHEIQRNKGIVANLAEKFIRPNIQGFVITLEKEIKAGVYREVDPRQVILDMIGLCIYPFIAKPLIQPILGMDDIEYAALIEKRKKHIPEHILNNLKKHS